jgi:uncharacterized protein YraI
MKALLQTRRLLAACLALLLALAMTPVTALAGEAAVSTEEELHKAVEDAGGATTILLQENLYLEKSVEIPAGKDITLDLNGHEITVKKEAGRSLYAVSNRGRFTLTDSGAGGSITARGIQNLGDGEMVINGGRVIACDDNGGATLWNEAKLTVNGGTFEAMLVGTPGDAVGISCLYNMGEALITGGDFVDVNRRNYAISSNNKIEITPAAGSTVNVRGAHGGLAVDAGTAVINGGNFSSDEFYGLYVSNDGRGTDPEMAAVTVNGGNFDGKTVSVWIGSDVNNPVNSTIAITGGTYAKALNAQNNTREKAIVVTGGEFAQRPKDEQIGEGMTLASLQHQDTMMYHVGTPQGIVDALASRAQSGDTIVVMQGDANLAGVAAGVKAENKGDGVVLVNGAPLAKDEQAVTEAPKPQPQPDKSPNTEPEYYPDYKEDVEYVTPEKNENKTYAVVCRTLNVRGGAGTAFAKIGTLSRGAIIKGEAQNGWVKFDFDGSAAYVSAAYVQEVGDASNLSVICRTLNVRSGAGTSFAKIGALTRGTSIDVVDAVDGWYKIAYDGAYGYVSSAYVG